MSKDINEVIKNWHNINTVNEYYSNEKMLIWALEHCQSKFYHRGNKWWFSNEKDATVFALKYADYIGEERVPF